MTAPFSLKFVPRPITIAATFSLSLLVSCAKFPSSALSALSPSPQWNEPPPVTRSVYANQGRADVEPITGTVVADPAYLIGPEDALEISVWRDETLKSSVLVRPDGGVSFPLVGDFIVAGKTASQVRDELTKRLGKFVPEPVVTVSVVRVSSYRIYVLGRVNKPGDFQVGRNVDVLQALAIAGGMTPFASEDGIRIIRKINGQSTSLPFQYSRVRKGGDLSQNITLKSGDVLLVP